MAQVGRSHRSVEFKHQNISAVLDALGMPWIKGYKPKLNYQNAIFDAIDRYLTRNPDFIQTASSPTLEVPSDSSIFVAPPTPTSPAEVVSLRLRRLVQKFDPVERDNRNRALGKAGEAFVVELERRRLVHANRADLLERFDG